VGLANLLAVEALGSRAHLGVVGSDGRNQRGRIGIVQVESDANGGVARRVSVHTSAVALVVSDKSGDRRAGSGRRRWARRLGSFMG
jgi:hypothetical protein